MVTEEDSMSENDYIFTVHTPLPADKFQYVPAKHLLRVMDLFFLKEISTFGIQKQNDTPVPFLHFCDFLQT